MRTGPFNRALYKERNVVEHTIKRLKQFRRMATRYEKRASISWLWSRLPVFCFGYDLQTGPSPFN